MKTHIGKVEIVFWPGIGLATTSWAFGIGRTLNGGLAIGWADTRPANLAYGSVSLFTPWRVRRQNLRHCLIWTIYTRNGRVFMR